MPVCRRVSDRRTGQHLSDYRVALLGLGTVGRAVAQRLMSDADLLAERAGGRRLTPVLFGARNPARLAGLALPTSAVESELRVFLERAQAEADVVVELIGGLEPAGEVVGSGLRCGLAVVTANKHLLAERGAELEQLSRSTGAALRFEAAVGGGTPVVGLLAADLAALRVERVRGVVNGTTNWILDAMEERGLSAGEALAAAQSAGYAEADSALDIEGHDAAHKLVILARLAFGRWLRPATIVRVARRPPGTGQPGIAGVSGAEVAAAARRGERIRLVAEAATDPGLPGGPIEASVLPRALPLEDQLAGARGVGNMIELYGQPLGRMTVSGPGAGGPATAAAVLADLIALARGAGSSWAGLPPAQ